MEDKKLQTYTIGQLAKAASMNVQTLRFYERRGILRPFLRNKSGYRVYNEDSLKRLRFVKKGKSFGFSLKEINHLLELNAPCAENCNKVRFITLEKLKSIKKKISQLKQLERTLKILTDACKKRPLPDRCPILNSMES